MSKPCPVVLTIAGSDSSAGAGLQADIKTCGAMGAFACSVVTAVTAQSPSQMAGVYALPAKLVSDQINAVARDFDIAVVKLGMLGNLAIAEVVAEFIARTGLPAVIDPVFKASVGGDLCSSPDGPTAVRAFYRAQLAPLATVFTPNLDEAAALLDSEPASDHSAYEQQALALLGLGSSAVLLKGGHSLDERLCTDYLAYCDSDAGAASVRAFSAARINTPHGHGSGCTLASAIAAGLAQGLTIVQATAAAKNYVQNSLINAARLALVPSNGPLHHFASFW
ncbi:MAG TPA: bifunctional hydroxymethylpyrimidine kinase/phosphomethylpyrimidine kinase [Marinagarivorans sp.]